MSYYSPNHEIPYGTAETTGHSVLFCLRALCREMEALTAGMLFQDAKSAALGQTKLVPLKVYEQSLPVPSGEVADLDDGEGETIDHVTTQVETGVVDCPWCVVRADSGTQKLGDRFQEVTFAVIFGLYDDDTANIGHRGLLNLIDKFQARFLSDPILDKQYINNNDFEWSIDREDNFPYIFGSVSTTFKIPRMGRKESRYT